MSGELINRLNEEGEIIGVTDKTLAHRMGIWHNVLRVWIINDNNEVLIQKRNGTKNINPNLWDSSFGAHLTIYETPQQCMARKSLEELGYKMRADKAELVYSYKEKTKCQDMLNNEFVNVYISRENINIDNIQPEAYSIKAIKWIPLKTLIKMMNTKDPSMSPHYTEFDFLLKYLPEHFNCN